MHIIIVLLLILVGCTNSAIRPEWNLPPEKSYTGNFKNSGQEAEGRTVLLRNLTGFFWPGSLLDADSVKLSEEPGQIQAEAIKNGAVIRSEVYKLTNGSLIITRNEAKGGALYETVDRFIRIQTGLVVERREAGISASIPFIGQGSYWFFYPLK